MPDGPDGAPPPVGLFVAVGVGEAMLLVDGDLADGFEVAVRVVPGRGVDEQPGMPDGSPVTWAELFAGTSGEPVRALQGSFVEDVDGTVKVTEVLWRGEESWQAFNANGSGGIQLDGTAVLVDQGVEVKRTRDATLGGSSVWRQALGAKAPSPTSGTRVVSIEPVDWAGRRCWRVVFQYRDMKPEMVVDRDFGVVLHESGPGRSRGFESVRFNDEVTDAPAGWTGQRRADARPGTAYVADDAGTGLFGGHIEIDAGPCSLMVRGPDDVSIVEMLEWSRSQVDRIQVRWRNRHYSAGEQSIGEPDLPLDEVSRDPQVTPELRRAVLHDTELMRAAEGPTWRWLHGAISGSGMDPEGAVVAAILPDSAEGFAIVVVVHGDEQVRSMSGALEDEVEHPPGRNRFDQDLTDRWQHSRVRDEVAAAIEHLRRVP